MRSSQKNRMTGGGKNKSSNKLFKCAATSKLNNLIKNINGKVDNSYFQNLRNTSRELSKNEKSLNNHMNKMLGGGHIDKEKFIKNYGIYKNQVLSLSYGCDKLQELIN